MISERYIKEWAATHPWRRAEQVEQDMLLSRVLVAIYSDTEAYLRVGIGFDPRKAWLVIKDCLLTC